VLCYTRASDSGGTLAGDDLFDGGGSNGKRTNCASCAVLQLATAAAAAPRLAIRELLCCRSLTKRPLGSSTLQSAAVWQDGAAHAGDHDGGNKRVMINENNSSDSSELLKSSVVPL
jgi:hypothetical protein